MRAHRKRLPVETFLLVLGCGLGLGQAAIAQNVQWGPFRMTAGATLGADYRDNANTSEHHPKSDVVLTMGPTLSGGVFLPFAGGEEFLCKRGRPTEPWPDRIIRSKDRTIVRRTIKSGAL